MSWMTAFEPHTWTLKGTKLLNIFYEAMCLRWNFKCIQNQFSTCKDSFLLCVVSFLKNTFMNDFSKLLFDAFSIHVHLNILNICMKVHREWWFIEKRLLLYVKFIVIQLVAKQLPTPTILCYTTHTHTFIHILQYL